MLWRGCGLGEENGCVLLRGCGFGEDIAFCGVLLGFEDAVSLEEGVPEDVVVVGLVLDSRFVRDLDGRKWELLSRSMRGWLMVERFSRYFFHCSIVLRAFCQLVLASNNWSFSR